MLRSTTLAAVALSVALLTPQHHARAGAAAFPFTIHQATLPSGLKVIAIPFDSPGIIAYYTVVRTGSRNEVEPGKSGFAHFFEHMMFRGTPRYSEDEYARVLKRMGADTNAWTWDDQTTYHIVASASGLATLVELEADRFQHLEYSEAVFQKEARAVLGEYNKSASNPRQKLREALRELAFDAHTYKHTTMGFLRDIKAMPQQFAYSKQFFDRYYRPGNCVVIVAGDVKPDELFALTRKHYGGWGKGPPTPAVPQEPPQRSEKRSALTWPAPTLPRLVMGYKVPGFTPKTQAALDVLENTVFAKRGPLYRKLVVEEQKVASLKVANYHKVDTHLFEVWVSARRAEDLPAIEAEIQSALDAVARDGVDAKTLAESTSHMRYRFAGELGTANGVASNASWFVSLTGDIGTVNTLWDAIAKVTPEDLKRAAAKYLVSTQRTVITLTTSVQDDTQKKPAGRRGDAR